MFKFNEKTHKLFNLIMLGVIVALLISRVSGTKKVNMLDNDQPYSDTLSEQMEVGKGQTIAVRVFFGGPTGDELIEERRSILSQGDKAANIKLLLMELLNAPEGKQLTSVIPRGTKLRKVYVDQHNICYLDFSKEFTENAAGGSSAELLTINAVLHTIAKNFSVIKKVQFLVEGEEVETIRGHIDLRFPLELDRSDN